MSVLELLKMPHEMKVACVEAAVMDGKMDSADAKLVEVRAKLKAMGGHGAPGR